jgi:hypothetical protein
MPEKQVFFFLCGLIQSSIKALRESNILKIEFEFKSTLFSPLSLNFHFDMPNLVYNVVSMTGFRMKINYSILGIYIILNTSLNSKIKAYYA